ncbi:hypothetical protein EYC80_006043 [Monilinia laxa]|uniref:Uncharacterized protein n=1 Tax=Monilinia laxa TaxID=61186 RepID=A0A5N6KGI0_MONLA|nr:hypothetical protein EYC80_006043 [Monilinia laxa]
MAPKKDITSTPSRIRLPRAAKDNLKELPEPIPKTTSKPIKRSPGRPKKAVSTEISGSKASSFQDAKGKAKETEIVTLAVPSAALDDEIIRQEATYPNPFSTESSRQNTAALLSQWDAIKSPGPRSPNLEKRLVNGTAKSTSTRSAKSKHERAHSTSNQRHITIPPPASKERGEQTSQVFDVDKQHRLNSLAEGRFPDPTYPRASISNGTEISPGFNAAMGFRYSPGFGGPHGFNPSPRNQYGLALRRHSSAMFGTGGSQIGPNTVRHSSAGLGTADLPSSEQTKSTGPTIPNADAGPSSRIDGSVDGPSPFKNTFAIPDPSSPEYLPNFPTDWNNYMNFNQDRFTGQDFGGYQGYQGYQSFQPGSFGFHRPVGQSFSPYGSLFGPGNPQYYNPKILNTGNDSSWTAPQMSGFPSMSEYPSVPSFPSLPQNIEHQGSPQLEQITQTLAEISEPLGIRESRMTREKTMFVPGGKIIKTTTTVFKPTDEENRKGKSVERVPEDKVGIVVVDKEGNVDVESGDWLAGFNRIEGWEVEALLHQSKRWRSHKNKNGANKKRYCEETRS